MDSSAWNRAGLAALAIAAAAAASLAWLAHPWYEGDVETNDAAIYLLTAKSILAGEGVSYLGTPFTIRPPGFPLLIAPVIAWLGLDFQALNLEVGLLGAAALALLFLFARPRLGGLASACLCAAAWLNPGWQRMCNQVMSDVPGAGLFLACLLIGRWAETRPSARRDALLGACIAAASLVRSVHVLLVPAIAIARALARERAPWPRFARERVLVLAAVSALLLLPWSLRNAAVRPDGPVDQNFLHSYSTAMWHQDGGDPGSPRREAAEILGRIPVRAGQVLSVLGGRMGDESGGASRIAIGAALLAALVVVAWRRRESAEIFALLALGVLLLYFGFRARLVLPIWIVALVGAAEVVAIAIARATGESRARLATAALLLLLALLDARPREGFDRIQAGHRAREATAAALNARLPASARLAAPIGWHWSVRLDRPVYSLFFAVRRAKNLQAVDEVLAKYRIDAVVMGLDPPDDPTLLEWFRRRYGPEERAGDGAIFRVR